MLIYDQILDRIENLSCYDNVYDGKALPLIENFKKENLQATSYDVTMNSQVMKFQESGKLIHLDNKEAVDNLYETIEAEDGYKLHPQEFVLVRLNEKINMPNDLAGHIRPRTTFNKLGLIITSQHINPSYIGNLQVGIKNETPHTMVLKPGLTIGQIIFEEVDKEIRPELLYKNKANAKYHEESQFVGSKIYNEEVVKEAYKLFTEALNKKN